MCPHYERDEGGELVPAKAEVPEEAVSAIEHADEQAIVERLTNVDAQPVFAYSYEIAGKEIIGIGVDGAKEIANQVGNISVSPNLKVEEKDDYFYAMVPVTNLGRNVTLLGVARQSKYILGKGMVPTDRIDETGFVKAISKAQRNGILAVVSQQMIADIMQRLESKAIKKLPSPPTYGQSAPPKEKPKAEDNTKKLRQQAGMEWKKTDKSDDERAAWLKENFNGKDSLTQLDEGELNYAIAQIKQMQPHEPTLEELGFSSQAEQTQFRRDLFRAMEEIGLDTDEKKKEWLATKRDITAGASGTKTASKQQLEKLIEEVNKQKEIAGEADNISDEV